MATATATDPRRGRAPLCSLALALIVCVWSSTGWAHSGGESHRAIVSAETDKVRALLLMQIPAGQRADQLMLRHDLNRDGRLGPLESQMLGARLGPEVVGGWVLLGGKGALTPDHLAVRCTRSQSGGLLIALLMEYPLPAAGDRIEVRLLPSAPGTGAAKGVPMAIEMQAQGGIATSSHTVARDAPVVGPLWLQPGGESAWIIPRAAP